MDWRLLVLGTVLLWGVQGVLFKYALGRASWMSVLLFSTVGTVIGLAFVLLFAGIGEYASDSVPYATLAGVFGILGFALLMAALKTGNVSIVMPLSTLYVAVTVILAYVVLGERLSALKVLGVVLAILAGVLLSL